MDAGEGRVAEKRPRYECLLFDLDDTLYPLSSGLAAECRKNIQDYMVEKLGIEESKVPDLAVSLYRDYGTTMAGLRGSHTEGMKINPVRPRCLIFSWGHQRKYISLCRGQHFSSSDDGYYQK